MPLETRSVRRQITYLVLALIGLLLSTFSPTGTFKDRHRARSCSEPCSQGQSLRSHKSRIWNILRRAAAGSP